MIEFGDAINPNFIPYKYAALYAADTDHPCPPGAGDRWPVSNKRWITFHGDPEASIMDFEQGTSDFENPIEVRDWLHHRETKPRPAWVYSDFSNAAAAAKAADGYMFRWWIATLDDVMRSAEEISLLLEHWGVPTHLCVPDLIAAQQWKAAGTYDGSIVYRDW